MLTIYLADKTHPEFPLLSKNRKSLSMNDFPLLLEKMLHSSRDIVIGNEYDNSLRSVQADDDIQVLLTLEEDNPAETDRDLELLRRTARLLGLQFNLVFKVNW